MDASTQGEGELPVQPSKAPAQRDYKQIYQKRKANPKQYARIKEKNREWIAAHPEVNAQNQRHTRKRRTLQKSLARTQQFPNMVKVSEVARQLEVTRQRAHQLIQQGALGQIERDGKIVLVHQHAIDVYLEAKRQRDTLTTE